MRSVSLFIITGVLAVFGLLTLFMSSSVVFDLFNIRAHQGNYVAFVVWANFFSGILFLIAAFAFFKERKWSPIPLMVSLGILVVAFVGLLIHISGDGAYEAKTVGAMIFRMTLNTAFILILYSHVKKRQVSRFAKAGMLAWLPLALLVAGCGQGDGNAHNHQAVESEGSHHHEDVVGPISLNKGEKWEADEHTFLVVKDMKSALSDFENAGRGDYQVLADSLSQKLNVLVAGCTMEGSAHDELHKWLVPFTEHVKDLAASPNDSEAHVEIRRIDQALDAFDDSFEFKGN